MKVIGLRSIRASTQSPSIKYINFYLAVNNLIVFPIPNYFLPKQRFTRFFFNNSFIQPSCNNDYYRYSFFPRRIRDWNSLLSNIISTKYSSFKDHCSSFIRNE